MKRLLATTALVLTTATAGMVHAQDADQLRETVANELAATTMSVDVSMLSDEEVSELYAILTSTDDEGEAMQKARGVLAGSGAVTMEDPDGYLVVLGMEQDQFDEAVEQILTSMGYSDIDVAALSQSQKAEIYTIATSTDMESNDMDRIETIIGM